MARTRVEMVQRAAWWRRRPWPVVVLGVDPAAEAGAAIALPFPPPAAMRATGESEEDFHLLHVEEVRTNSLELEGMVDVAAGLARSCGLQLVVCLEDWGSGGRLGIKQWLGMGAAAGAWTRAVQLATNGHGDVLTVTRSILRVQQVRWRSRMIEESGTRDGAGKYKPHDSEGWKKAATATVARLFPYVRLEGANAAEAALIAAYAMRSDELGRLLPATYLRKHGVAPLPPEAPTPKKGRKKRG